VQLITHVALVSQVPALGLDKTSVCAAALQRQVTRDFGPLWGIQATVNAFGTLKAVPTGYWPIIIKRNINTPGAGGVHEDSNGQPFALVQFAPDWTLTTSHECLEMLADPFGNRLLPGQSPKPEQGRVEFLVEVCDPPEAAQFAYTVNGVTVSDFFTPHFFDPVASAGVRYSFTGAVTAPRQVLQGGYLSWHDPVTNHWFQLTRFGTDQFRDLGVLAAQTGQSLRSMVDRLTAPLLIGFANSKKKKKDTDKAAASLLTSSAQSVAESGEAAADRLQTQIDSLAE
jgi:hypothetical protein